MSQQRQSSATGRYQSLHDATLATESLGRSPVADGDVRASSIARLASPVCCSNNLPNSPPNRQVSQQSVDRPINRTQLAGSVEGRPSQGPGRSDLAAALQSASADSPSVGANLPAQAIISANPLPYHVAVDINTNYGSVDSRAALSTSRPPLATIEDPRVVKRHLVQASDSATKNARFTTETSSSSQHEDLSAHETEFSSLKLQGGDMTREVYRWTEDAESSFQGGRAKRSKSWHVPRPEPEDETMDVGSIRIPGGFRRDHLRRRGASPSAHNALNASAITNGQDATGSGEELEDNDEDSYFDVRTVDQAYESDDSIGEPGEGSALLTPSTPGRRKRKVKERGVPGTNTTTGAALLLLKSFVGTGVLFLPRAYLNGGMLFSNLVLLAVAMLSYYCFILLVRTRIKVHGSFGDIGGILYGKWLRTLILASVALSQVGFVSAYIVFTSESMQAFFNAVSDCKTVVDIKTIILVQLVIFLPLSLIRDISKLGITALIADAFILLGLIYLGYFDIHQIVKNHGVADIVPFNPQSWTLFIGTAIFTFEGVGLIIPIQESMKEPAKFPPVLAGVMIVITVVFVSIGALSYAAFGSATRTVVLLNLPQDNTFVNAVQLLYSLAILLSTPLQLFPAIRILESELFSRSGKYSAYIKWQKNIFRFLLVIGCALIAWGGAGDLDKFVSLVGSFACVPLVYVYPAMLHFKAVAKTKRQKIIDCVLCFFGILAMIYTTGQTIWSWAASSKHSKAPSYCDERSSPKSL